MLEAMLVPHELPGDAGRVAPQRQDVLGALLGKAIEQVYEVVASVPTACDVGHRFNPRLLANPPGQFDGQFSSPADLRVGVGGGAARVGNRDIGWLQRPEFGDGPEQRVDPLLRVRREKLEREARLGAPEAIGNPHPPRLAG